MLRPVSREGRGEAGERPARSRHCDRAFTPGSQDTASSRAPPTGRVIPEEVQRDRFLQARRRLMRRLLLVRHASTAAVRAAAFGADESLDERGRAAAARLGDRLPRGELLVSPARRAIETAAGLGHVREVPELAECDFGPWAGLSLDAIAPEPLGEWMTDPDAAPHGGESLTALLGRVGAWLETQAELDGTAIAITHGGVVKAAVVTALEAPPSAFWRVDVAPLSITELHAHDGRWTVTRVNDREEMPRGETAAAAADSTATDTAAGTRGAPAPVDTPPAPSPAGSSAAPT